MNVLWSHTQVAFFISAKFAEAPAACRNFSTQMGVRAATTAVAARFVARVSAVPPVTQPPQLNPTMARAIAPAAAAPQGGPHRNLCLMRDVHGLIFTWKYRELHER